MNLNVDDKLYLVNNDGTVKTYTVSCFYSRRGRDVLTVESGTCVLSVSVTYNGDYKIEGTNGVCFYKFYKSVNAAYIMGARRSINMCRAYLEDVGSMNDEEIEKYQSIYGELSDLLDVLLDRESRKM